MTRALTLAGILALAACSAKEDDAPLRATPKPQPVVVMPPRPAAPAPWPAPATPAEPAPAPRQDPKPEAPKTTPARPAAAAAAAPPPLPRRPAALLRLDEVHLPAFTLRTVDQHSAKVEINGAPITATTCLWAVTSTIEFDRAFPIGDVWPPEGARYAGKSTQPEDPRTTAEVCVQVRPDLRRDECLLLVKGTIRGEEILGAVRLRIAGCRYTMFTPLVDPEGEEASRLARTIWFQRIEEE